MAKDKLRFENLLSFNSALNLLILLLHNVIRRIFLTPNKITRLVKARFVIAA